MAADTTFRTIHVWLTDISVNYVRDPGNGLEIVCWAHRTSLSEAASILSRSIEKRHWTRRAPQTWVWLIFCVVHSAARGRVWMKRFIIHAMLNGWTLWGTQVARYGQHNTTHTHPGLRIRQHTRPDVDAVGPNALGGDRRQIAGSPI